MAPVFFGIETICPTPAPVFWLECITQRVSNGGWGDHREVKRKAIPRQSLACNTTEIPWNVKGLTKTKKPLPQKGLWSSKWRAWQDSNLRPTDSKCLSKIHLPKLTRQSTIHITYGLLAPVSTCITNPTIHCDCPGGPNLAPILYRWPLPFLRQIQMPEERSDDSEQGEPPKGASCAPRPSLPPFPLLKKTGESLKELGGLFGSCPGFPPIRGLRAPTLGRLGGEVFFENLKIVRLWAGVVSVSRRVRGDPGRDVLRRNRP